MWRRYTRRSNQLASVGKKTFEERAFRNVWHESARKGHPDQKSSRSARQYALSPQSDCSAA
ncbi:hypothetical protein B0G80_1437 [Paraburkholderia sp. BL6669N2]|nr:hypothetical protein B0G80_1437 [Paraburkholderia sp. BL6669N2]